jgi:hypothetical protein
LDFVRQLTSVIVGVGTTELDAPKIALRRLDLKTFLFCPTRSICSECFKVNGHNFRFSGRHIGFSKQTKLYINIIYTVAIFGQNAQVFHFISSNLRDAEERVGWGGFNPDSV